MSEKPKILMAVFNALDFDGRVQRSAESLAEVSDLEVLALDGNKGFRPQGYRLVTVPTAPGEFGSNRMLHFRFLRELVRRARRDRPDVLYAHDFFLAFSGWLAARLSGARLIYDAHELIIPGSLGDKREGFLQRVWYRLERLVIRRADLVFSANEVRAEFMVKHYGLKTTPVAIRNITRPPADRSPDRAQVLARHPFLVRQSPDECLCIYQGDVDLDRGLGVLIEAFPLLGKQYRLLVVGGGPDVENIRHLAVRLQDSAKIEVVGKVPRQSLFEILQACDIGVVMYSFSGFNNIYCAPNKVYEYAQADLPVVGTGQPPLVRQVHDSGIGAIAGAGKPPTPREVADAIQAVQRNRAAHKTAIPAFLAENRWEEEANRTRASVAALLRGSPVVHGS
jgi:glycosyltransferase involved in cell wall biosynthesis